MSTYHELVAKGAPEWPYTVNYARENEVAADVLVIGGGLAGCHAAINAAKRGAKVAIADKAPVIISGSGDGQERDHGGLMAKHRVHEWSNHSIKGAK